MNFILNCFGYVKIPKEAIQVSLKQESLMQDGIELFEASGKAHFAKLFKKQLEGQKALTSFLQTGRTTGLWK